MKLKRLRKFNHQATEQELSYRGILELLLNKSEYNLHGDGMHHHYLHRDGTGLPAVPSKDFLYLELRHEAGSRMPGREASQPPQAEKGNRVRLGSTADSHQDKLLAARAAKSTRSTRHIIWRLRRTGMKVSPHSCKVVWWKPIDHVAAGLALGFTLEERDTHNILYAFILVLWGNQISTSRKRAGTEQFKVPTNCIHKCSGVGIALSVLIK